MWGRIWWAANNRKWITVVLKRVSVLCVNASWEWRTRTSSRCIKNRLADFGTIKPPTFLKPFISSSSFTYFVFYFVCMYVFLFSFKPSGSKRTQLGLPCVCGQAGEQAEDMDHRFSEVQGWIQPTFTKKNVLFPACF